MNILKTPVKMSGVGRIIYQLGLFLAICSFVAGLVGLLPPEKAGLLGSVLLLPVVGVLFYFGMRSSGGK